MANENGSKTPTWQWVAITAISILLVLAAFLLNATRADIKETRADIKEVRMSSAAIGLRVMAIETSMPLQFEAIKLWREEIKLSLNHMIVVQEKINSKLDKSAVTLDQWKKIK